jgi:hypothetical protein
MIIAVLAITALALASCGTYTATPEQSQKIDDRFSIIYEYKSMSSQILVDKETNVQYFLNYHGGIYPLIDQNGNPLLYEVENAD